MTRLLLTLLFAAAGTASYAGGSGNGFITQIGGQVSGQSAIYFGMSPAPSNRPACSTNNDYQFVIDPSTVGGQKLQEAILFSKKTNTKIIVVGTGNCILNQPMESVSYWVLDPQ